MNTTFLTKREEEKTNFLIPTSRDNNLEKSISYRTYDNRQIKDKLFLDFLQEFIIRKEKARSKSCANQFITIYNHIENYQEEYHCTLYTDSIGEEFLYDFINYLKDLELMQSTIKGMIARVKEVCKKAAVYGYPVNPTFSEVNIKGEDPYTVYLTQNQITRLYYCKDLTKEQERIRDLFVLQCLTGFRFSDLTSLKEENFNLDKRLITVTQQKTKNKVIVPIHPYTEEIFKKYNGFLPNDITLQHYNREIKKICKLIGLNEEVTYKRIIGHNSETICLPFYEMVSSHTARRSFCTNLYNSGNITALNIAKLSGHATESNLMRYLHIESSKVALGALATNAYFIK